MNRITVVNMGAGARELITLGALEKAENSPRVILRTGRHEMANLLAQRGKAFETLDALYDACGDFDELCARASAYVIACAEQTDVCFCVFDASCDRVAQTLLAQYENTVLTPGVPLCSPCLASAGVTDARACAASDLTIESTSRALLVTELNSALCAGEVKLKLLDWYDGEQEILFFPPGAEEARAYVRVPLCALDRQPSYDHTAAALVPALPLTARKRYDFSDLVRIMDILRGENGCPWDIEQTHQSLRPYLIEEAYETAAAIDEGDFAHVADELGDVLLQVVFHGNVGRQYGTLTLGDITTAVCQKMIHRHEHIFGQARCDTAQDVVNNWERIKKEERRQDTQTAVLRGVSSGLPPLMRAEKVQKKARQVGFDWDDPRDALAKVREEADEVLQELDDARDPAEEIGDLLFACVNVARLSGVSAELALQSAVEKFINRFQSMENAAKTDGKCLKDLTLGQMDVYWERSKQR